MHSNFIYPHTKWTKQFTTPDFGTLTLELSPIDWDTEDNQEKEAEFSIIDENGQELLCGEIWAYHEIDCNNEDQLRVDEASVNDDTAEWFDSKELSIAEYFWNYVEPLYVESLQGDSLIQAELAKNPTFNAVDGDVRWDVVEVSPVCAIIEDGKVGCWEVCEPAEADMWSVYLHMANNTGVRCVADLNTEEQANALAELLRQSASKYIGMTIGVPAAEAEFDVEQAIIDYDIQEIDGDEFLGLLHGIGTDVPSGNRLYYGWDSKRYTGIYAPLDGQLISQDFDDQEPCIKWLVEVFHASKMEKQ